MNEQVAVKLNAHNWEHSIIRLAAYATVLHRLHTHKIPLCIEPEDIVMDAIARVYNGSRVWNPESDPDLELFMKSVIKSLVNNLIRDQKIDTVGIELGMMHTAPDTIKHHEDLQDLDEKIGNRVRGDTELALVFKSLKDGMKPLEMSEEYRLDIEIIRNAQRRLRRVVIEVVGTK